MIMVFLNSNIKDLGIDRVFNRYEDDRFQSRLLFHVQELGCVKELAEDELPLYIPGTQCEEALKDIIKYIKSNSIILY